LGARDCIISEYNGVASFSRLKSCNEPASSFVAPAVRHGKATGKQTFIILLINSPLKIFRGKTVGIHVIFTVSFTFVRGLALINVP
jgi:hypothetical protein